MPASVSYESVEGVGIITMSRPETLNAFGLEMVQELFQQLMSARADEQIGALIITGDGPAFCAGGDLKMMSKADNLGDLIRQLAMWFHTCIHEIRSIQVPVIAAINGPAAGGGFSLALACDLRVMADHTFMQQAYTSSGLAPDGGSSFTLPRLVGLSRASEIMLLDEKLTASQCAEMGLANFVVNRDQVLEKARTIARKLVARSRLSNAHSKHLLNRSLDGTLAAQLELERRAIAECSESPEGGEGIAAFLGRRKPDFIAARKAEEC